MLAIRCLGRTEPPGYASAAYPDSRLYLVISLLGYASAETRPHGAIRFSRAEPKHKEQGGAPA